MMATKAPTIQEIYDEQRRVAAETAAQQQALAERAAAAKQKTLQDQLAAQRQAYTKQVASVNESNFGVGNRLLEGLSGRGLATSGLLQLGQIQAQAQKGRSISDLADTNRQVVQGVMAENRNTQNDLYAALSASKQYKSQQDLAANQGQFAAEKQASEERLAAQNEIMAAQRAALAGEITPEEFSQMVANYEAVYGSMGSAGLVSEVTRAADPLYSTAYNELFDWGNVGLQAGVAAGAGALGGTAVAPGVGTGIGALGGLAAGAGLGLGAQTAQELGLRGTSELRYNIGGTAQNFSSIEQAEQAVRDLYAGDQYASQIQVKADDSFAIRFWYNGKSYKTYNEAVNAIRASK